MTREDWLSARKNTVGGSDAAAIVGLNPYASAYSVWAEKRGLLPEKEETEAMRIGRDLEEYVASRFTEKTGLKVRRKNAIIQNPDYPFAHANVDRLIVGEDAGLECKTTSIMNLSKFKNGEYPSQYYVQSVHYMAVTGAKKWYLAVLVLGEGLHIFEIERDEAEIAALMKAEEDFMKSVETGEAPSVDGAKATSDAIKTVYAESDDESISLVEVSAHLVAYQSLCDEIKRLEAQKEAEANVIKAHIPFRSEQRLAHILCFLKNKYLFQAHHPCFP